MPEFVFVYLVWHTEAPKVCRVGLGSLPRYACAASNFGIICPCQGSQHTQGDSAFCCNLALEQSSRLPREDSGYASVFDVTNSSSSHRDEMKGWLLTTFKWVWLLQREAGKSDAESEMSALLPRDAIPSTVGHVLLTTWS